MDQTNIIRDLLRWIDDNLDKPLSLDNVAAKRATLSGIYKECSKR